MLGRRGHQGLVGDAEHLTGAGQPPQQGRHRPAHPAAHPGIDLIEQQAHLGIRARQAGFQRQQKAAHLSPRSHLRQGRQGLPRVGGKEVAHPIGPLFAEGTGRELHRESHMGQPHGPKRFHQLGLQGGGGLAPGLREPPAHMLQLPAAEKLPLL